jgi:tripartite-type tricarboxylate transporter receptor subunit TctC
MKWITACAAVAAAQLLAAPASAQNYPSRPIRVIVPFEAAGAMDVVMRVVAKKIADSGAAQIVVENKTGAGGVIGVMMVKNAAPDGDLLADGSSSTHVLNPHTTENIPYDPVKDFQPVALVAMLPNVLAINPKLPVNSFQEFVAYAKANPGKLNYSSGGQGSAAHIAGAYLCFRAGIEAVHVPYRGTAPSVNDLVAGSVDFTLTGGPAVLPLAEGGQLKVLAVANRDRVPFAPKLPTIAESGLPGFEAVQWYGVVAPRRTPMEIVARLNREINVLLGEPEFSAALSRDGAIARPETPEGFGKLIASELVLWRDVITKAHITAGG